MCQNKVVNYKYIRNVLMTYEKVISLMTDQKLIASVLGINLTYNLGPCNIQTSSIVSTR